MEISENEKRLLYTFRSGEADTKRHNNNHRSKNGEEKEWRNGGKERATNKQNLRNRTADGAGKVETEHRRRRNRRHRSRTRWCGGLTATSSHHHHRLLHCEEKRLDLREMDAYLEVREVRENGVD
jgi:hypothetical protein